MAITRRFQFISDSHLVEMAQRGSLEAYDELVSRFRDAVVLVARQTVGSLEMAQDVAQEAFLLAYRSLGQLQDTSKFAGWLCMIARRRALRVAEGKSRVAAVETTSLDNLATDPADTGADSPLDLVIRAEQQEAVRALFAHLAPDCEIVLLLFYYEQWPAVRIAAFLSLPLTTVKWRLRYGRKQLTPHLAKLLGEQTGEQTGEQVEEREAKTEQSKQQESLSKQTRQTAQHKEKTDGYERSRAEERDTPNASAAGQDGRNGRTCRADGQLRERYSQLCETL